MSERPRRHDEIKGATVLLTGWSQGREREIAEAGEILATTSTVSSGAIPFGFGDEREVSLKGLDEPVHVVAIDWRVGN